MTETSNSNGELKRHLTFKDVFFLSFGGMSPLLSILTYAAFVITLVGRDAPIIMIIGMFIVLINGLSVTQLSKRFSSSGGYYTYAFQALSARIGFDTGWMYIFYSILYALAYLTGSIFIITAVLGISEYYAFLLIMVPSVTFLIVGISMSAKYALYAVAIEISLMLIIVFFSFVMTGGAAYIPNPVAYHISAGDIALGILFAMGIPTGYGSIAPVSGEISNPKKVVGRSVISVILIGGLLATLMVYAFANLILQNQIIISTSDKLPVISIILHNFGKYGIYLYYAAGIAVINDSILAILSFGSAASRTFFRMGYDKSFPSIFAKKIKDNPVVASASVSAIMVILPLIIMHYITVETAFIFLGTVAALGGLFIHVSANFSLIRVGLRRARRLMSRTEKGIFVRLKEFKEVILALTGAIISSVVLVYSAYSTVSWYTSLFLVWIVVGFILSEVKAITMKTSDDMMDISKEGKILAENLMNVKVMDARIPGLDMIVGINDPLRSALEKLLSKNIPYSIVIDENMKPVGTLYVIDILLLPKDAIDRGKVNQMHLEKVANVNINDDVTDAVRVLKENNVNILSIVDGAGKCTGTITEREVLIKLASNDKPVVD
ncbi:amino acid permease [Ferroplasma sp.]|uniref:amino acid permease n=1 Tax=Ferroplasma sp. TaxID=2591003 RepID=UPI00307CD619